MTKTDVLFVQGGGKGAYDEDAALAASLERALGGEYDVRMRPIRMASPGNERFLLGYRGYAGRSY